MALEGSTTTNHFSNSEVLETWMTFSWSATQDQEKNCTIVTWNMKANRKNTTNFVYFYVPKVTINGNTIECKPANYRNGETIGTGTYTVWHSNEGNGTLSISMSANVYYSGGGKISKSKSWDLDAIPRNSWTDSKPDWTAPNSVTCDISRYASFTHTVVLQLKDSNGNWVDAYALYEQGTSATFSGEGPMKRVFEILATRPSCAARFTIGTNGPGGWTAGPEGTCTAANVNTISAPNFTATNSATVTINKGNEGFTTGIKVLINGEEIGKTNPISETSFTFNNTVELRTRSFRGLAQRNSLGYTVKATTYYSGVQVRGEQTASATCYAPSVNTVNTPDFTAGNSFTCNVSTVSGELSRKLYFQINNGSNWITIAEQGVTSGTSFTWQNNNITFGALGNGTSSRETRILTTTYYNGVQVRGETETKGTCYAPLATTCTAPNWTAGTNFYCNVGRSSNLLTHEIILQVRDSANNFQTFQSTGRITGGVTFANTVSLNTTLFRYLAQADSRQTKIIITTYYNDIRIRNSIEYYGTLSAPAASYCYSGLSWRAGEGVTTYISRALSGFSHNVTIQVNSITVANLTNIGDSFSFGTSSTDRENIFSALGQRSSAQSAFGVTTYYNGVQVRNTMWSHGTCSAPVPVTPSIPNWTAGRSFNASISALKDYLYYSIDLKVRNQLVQSYSYKRDSSLTFAETITANLNAYRGLATQAQTGSQFIIRMYYKKSDGNYIQTGPESITNGTCTALAANTITAPDWTAGSSFYTTINRALPKLFSVIRLRVNGELVQEITEITTEKDTDNLSYVITLANTEEINTKIYQALAQAPSRNSLLEIVTYYGENVNNKVQVRTPIQVSGTCLASEPAVGNLTFNETSAIIDEIEATCNLTIPLAKYRVDVEVSYNNTPITTLTSINGQNTLTFIGKDFMSQLYKAIPTQKSSSLQFKIITSYNGVQVQQPKILAIDVSAKEETVKVKVNKETSSLNTFAIIKNGIIENNFISNTSMIGSKKSALQIEIEEGYFYLEEKYGGYLKQIKLQIENSSSMLQLFNYEEKDIKYNNERTRIINSAFSQENNNLIVMGPYDFTNITKAGTINNLVITATDSRGYTHTETLPLTIFPYSAPTIEINSKLTERITETPEYLYINLNGTISSLFKEEEGIKNQTNLLDFIRLRYKVYAAKGDYIIYDIPLDSGSNFSYDNDYTTFEIKNFSTANTNPGITFSVGSTFELLITVKDKFGEENSDSIIILPNQPLLSFRKGRVGINIIPRKLESILERESEDALEDKAPSLDVYGYIYSNGREVPTFVIEGDSWETEEEIEEVEV